MSDEQPSDIKLKKKINFKKILIRVAITLILAAIVAVPILYRRRGSLLAVNTTIVKRGDVDEFLSVEARLVPKEIQKVTASGQTVLEVHVEEGEQVKRGQLLLTLDMSELERTLEERKKALEEQKKLMDDFENLMATLKRAGYSLDPSHFSKLTGNANALLERLNNLVAKFQKITDELPVPDADLIQNSLGHIEGILQNADDLMEKATRFIEDMEREIEQLRKLIADDPGETALRLLRIVREQLDWMRAMLVSSEATLSAAYDYLSPLIDELADAGADSSLIDLVTGLTGQLETGLAGMRQLIARIDSLLEKVDALIEEIEQATEEPSPSATSESTPDTSPSTSNEGTSDGGIRIGRARLQAGGIDSTLFSQGSEQGLNVLSMFTSGMGQYGQLMGLFDNSLEAAEKALAEAKPEVRAEFDGTIVHLNVKEGDRPSVFSSGAPLMEVYKRGEFEAVFQANENDAHRLEKGDKVDYLFAGMAFHGEITYKAPIAESASDLFGQSSFDLGGILGAVGGTSPTVTIRMSVEGENLDKLTPGFNIRADIEIGHKTDVLTVPVESLIRDKGRDCVFRLGDNDVATIVPIVLGLQGAATVEIISGVDAGDIVIVNPNPDIKDGTRVAVKTHTP